MAVPKDMTHDEILAHSLILKVGEGNKRGIDNLLAAGANVQGCPRVCIPPLTMSAGQDNLEMVKFLIAKGADVNAPCPIDPMRDNLGGTGTAPMVTGMRALHCAAESGSIHVVRFLLRAGADPLLKDENGHGAIFMACRRKKTSDEAEIVSTLIEAGADPGLADKDNVVPLHYAAVAGRDSVVDILLSESPGFLNRAVCEGGQTPLYFAAEGGHVSTVSLLLAAGAQQSRRLTENRCCPLATAVMNGHADVVRLLIDRGMEAIGGMSMVLPRARYSAVVKGHRSILGMVLKIGDEKMRETVRCFVSDAGVPLLHVAAGFAILPSVTALLSAGADERKADQEGWLARGIVGSYGDLNPKECPRHPMAVPAILRALERGPAFRARSWVWPSLRTAVDAAVPKATKSSPARCLTFDIRLFRPRDRSSVVGLFGRYANKI